MGKILVFEISFGSNKVVYSPGECITGAVKIVVGRTLQYKTIKVNCHGFCGVSNRENSSSWVLEEQYFNSTLSLADIGTLTPGEHSFPFQFLIPESSPTSFDGKFGRTVYRLTSVIETPRFSKDYNAVKPFYLLKPLNLNEVPDIEKPSSSQATKKFTYLLVKTGTVVLNAKCSMRGYIPGQVIELTTKIHNDSGKDTGHVLGALIQKVTYKTKRPIISARTIAEVQAAGVKAGGHTEWKEQIVVPSLPQSGLDGCRLIAIEYFIQVSLKCPEVLVTLPIYIGNLPISSPSVAPARAPPPIPADAPVPQPRVRSHTVTPTAPPADELATPAAAKTRAPQVKSCHSSPGLPPPVSPRTFRHTPNQGQCQSLRDRAHSSAGPMEGTIHFSGRNSTPAPTNRASAMQNRTSNYLQDPPPTYEESCSDNDPRFSAGRRPTAGF
ncbi:arrestin domain-containing protein 1-like [Paramormyrops kingsleyae]|uniref:Arrestin domain containing 1 n=1 Tax=Paramormyrops kingsleyae TaxID=1676925 RepID=A0A3B3R3Q0_9TELE|nr:arrestin domain-containing protein 1-like [Paramormyrops kingsleyae]